MIFYLYLQNCNPKKRKVLKCVNSSVQTFALSSVVIQYPSNFFTLSFCLLHSRIFGMAAMPIPLWRKMLLNLFLISYVNGWFFIFRPAFGCCTLHTLVQILIFNIFSNKRYFCASQSHYLSKRLFSFYTVPLNKALFVHIS